MSATRSTISPLSELPDIALTSPTVKESVTPTTLTDDELTYFHATRYVLRSHKNLSEDNVAFAANYIASFRAANVDPAFDDDQFAMFLTYADTTGIGKFALIFNEELDAAIKARDTTKLRELVLGPQEMFVEVYDNSFFTEEDREIAMRMLTRSIYAHQLLVNQLRQKVSVDTIDDTNPAVVPAADKDPQFHCPVITLTTERTATPLGVSAAALATMCYQEVCIQEAQILRDDPVRTQMNARDTPPEQVYAIDRAPSKKIPQVYCFETLELLAAVTHDPPINPKTNEPFSPESLTLITNKFRRELAMYRRYLQ